MPIKRNRIQHHGRVDLAGEHKLSDIGQIVCTISFLIVWILDSFIFKYSNFLSIYVPWWILIIIAIPIWGFAGYLAYKGMKTVFGTVHDTPGVITESVFKISRHPIYLGSMLAYIGAIISTLSLFSAGLFVFIAFFYNFVANFEENLLLEKFGEEYKQYIHDVPKWGIRLVKRKLKN